MGWRGPLPSHAEGLPSPGSTRTSGELTQTQVPGPDPVGLAIAFATNTLGYSAWLRRCLALARGHPHAKGSDGSHTPGMALASDTKDGQNLNVTSLVPTFSSIDWGVKRS